MVDRSYEMNMFLPLVFLLWWLWIKEHIAVCFVKLTPIQAAADDICWTPCSWNEALHKKAGYMYLHCVGSPRWKVCCIWKSSLPCPPPQDACCLLTSLSVVTQYAASWGKVCQLMSHPEACDHYFLIALWVEFFVSGLAREDDPKLMSSDGNCLCIFLFACFGMPLPLVYHATSPIKNTKYIFFFFKWTNHNNHTLPQTLSPWPSVFQVWLHICWLGRIFNRHL